MDSVPRTCKECLQAKPLTDFYLKRPGQYLTRCKVCHNAETCRKSKVKTAARKVALLARTEKACTRCGVVYPMERFKPRKDNPGTYTSHCRDCHNAGTRESKERYAADIKVKNRLYYQANAEIIRIRVKKCIKANPEKYSAMHSAWKKANKDAVNASTHKRRARLQHNGGSWTEADWQRLKARHDWRCLMCRKQEVTDGITLCFDHVVPLSLGGFNIISNAQPLCRSCNSLKHRKVLDLR